MSNHDKPTQEPCPVCGQYAVVQIISATPCIDPHVLGKYKVPSDFSGFLKNLKAKNPGSNINIM